MTLLVTVVGRSVRLGLATGETLLQEIDATWQVGSGRSFPQALVAFLDTAQKAPKDITRIAVASDHPSYTTIRTVFLALNTLAWIEETPMIELDATYAQQPLLPLLEAVNAAPHHPRLFPSYE